MLTFLSTISLTLTFTHPLSLTWTAAESSSFAGPYPTGVYINPPFVFSYDRNDTIRLLQILNLRWGGSGPTLPIRPLLLHSQILLQIGG